MRNDAGTTTLEYTELFDEYEGYIIAWAVSRSRSEPGRWMGHFRARKGEAPTIFGSVANLQDTEGAARDKAIEIAREKVAEATAEKS